MGGLGQEFVESYFLEETPTTWKSLRFIQNRSIDLKWRRLRTRKPTTVAIVLPLSTEVLSIFGLVVIAESERKIVSSSFFKYGNSLFRSGNSHRIGRRVSIDQQLSRILTRNVTYSEQAARYWRGDNTKRLEAV